VPLATALSLELGIRAAFVRKVAKPYGTAKLAEGAPVEGRRVVVVEDVVTSAGQVVASVGDLRAFGAVVDLALCVIDREEGGSDRLAALGVELRSLLRHRDLEAARSTSTRGRPSAAQA
jgi:orotate phosphoribosyltransferase